MTEMGVDADGNSTWQHTNVWDGGKLLATYDLNGVHFYLDDPLGTRRAQTDASGVTEQTCQSLPYGDGETCAPTPTEHLFTNKERDAETGNDYFEPATCTAPPRWGASCPRTGAQKKSRCHTPRWTTRSRSTCMRIC